MGDKLLINGVVFQGRTNILSWQSTPLAGGIKVQWSPNDFDIISGTTWTIQDVCTQVSYRMRYSSAGIITGTASVPKGVTGATISTVNVPTGWRFSGCNAASNVRVTFLSLTGTSGDPLVNQSNNQIFNYVPACHQIRATTLNPCFTSLAVWQTYFKMNTQGVGATQQNVSEQSITGIVLGGDKVVSNTLATSQRAGKTNPDISLLSGSCGLVINYVDGTSSPVMEFPQCPIVTELNDALCPSACSLSAQILSKLGG